MEDLLRADNLLALTTEGLEEVIGGELEWDKNDQPVPYLDGRVVIIPPYDDGYCRHTGSKLWASRNHPKFYAINPYGKRERFTDVCEAITFACMV